MVVDKPQKNGGNREALTTRLRCFGKAGENGREISQKKNISNYCLKTSKE